MLADTCAIYMQSDGILAQVDWIALSASPKEHDTYNFHETILQQFALSV